MLFTSVLSAPALPSTVSFTPHNYTSRYNGAVLTDFTAVDCKYNSFICVPGNKITTFSATVLKYVTANMLMRNDMILCN